MAWRGIGIGSGTGNGIGIGIGIGISWVRVDGAVERLLREMGQETRKETLGWAGSGRQRGCWNGEVNYNFSEVRHKKLTRQSKEQKIEVAK